MTLAVVFLNPAGGDCVEDLERLLYCGEGKDPRFRGIDFASARTA